MPSMTNKAIFYSFLPALHLLYLAIDVWEIKARITPPLSVRETFLEDK